MKKFMKYDKFKFCQSLLLNSIHSSDFLFALHFLLSSHCHNLLLFRLNMFVNGGNIFISEVLKIALSVFHLVF